MLDASAARVKPIRAIKVDLTSILSRPITNRPRVRMWCFKMSLLGTRESKIESNMFEEEEVVEMVPDRVN